jgi:hypothetical protein
MEETNMSEITLENKVQKLEDEIQQLKVELSIVLEFYGQIYELINELNHILKTKQLEKTKQNLTELEGFSLLKYENQTSPTKRPKIEEELGRVVDLIFQDYKAQTEGG